MKMAPEQFNTPRRSARLTQPHANSTTSLKRRSGWSVEKSQPRKEAKTGLNDQPVHAHPTPPSSRSPTAVNSAPTAHLPLGVSPASVSHEARTHQSVSHGETVGAESLPQAAQVLVRFPEASQHHRPPSVSPPVLEPDTQTTAERITNHRPLVPPPAQFTPREHSIRRTEHIPAKRKTWALANPPKLPGGPVGMTRASRPAPLIGGFTGFQSSTWYPLQNGSYFPSAPGVAVGPQTLPSLEDIVPEFYDCPPRHRISRTTDEDVWLRGGTPFEDRLVNGHPPDELGSSDSPVDLEVGTDEDMWTWEDREQYERIGRAANCLPPSFCNGRRMEACREEDIGLPIL
ncbi:hypothetical protein GGR57DRAFT_199749 [Xylariaceae sp. FL1272]|nr:hypothetical protein GGR57DRAFT_199749 [Xylariaceae sp. FL1272]